MTKQTLKSKVLDFVESQGTARRMEIIKFIVDSKFGEGAYDAEKSVSEDVYKWSRDFRTSEKVGTKKVNKWRGYHASAFNMGGNGLYGNVPVGNYMKDAGYGKLVRISRGLYKTVR